MSPQPQPPCPARVIWSLLPHHHIKLMPLHLDSMETHIMRAQRGVAWPGVAWRSHSIPIGYRPSLPHDSYWTSHSNTYRTISTHPTHTASLMPPRRASRVPTEVPTLPRCPQRTYPAPTGPGTHVVFMALLAACRSSSCSTGRTGGRRGGGPGRAGPGCPLGPRRRSNVYSKRTFPFTQFSKYFSSNSFLTKFEQNCWKFASFIFKKIT